MLAPGHGHTTLAAALPPLAPKPPGRLLECSLGYLKPNRPAGALSAWHSIPEAPTSGQVGDWYHLFPPQAPRAGPFLKQMRCAGPAWIFLRSPLLNPSHELLRPPERYKHHGSLQRPREPRPTPASQLPWIFRVQPEDPRALPKLWVSSLAMTWGIALDLAPSKLPFLPVKGEGCGD